jgi:hypothetical protein
MPSRLLAAQDKWLKLETQQGLIRVLFSQAKIPTIHQYQRLELCKKSRQNSIDKKPKR